MENVTMPTSHENEIVMVLSGMGMIIGRVAESGRGIIINPRITRIMPKDDKIQITLHKLIGDPEVFYLSGSSHYVVKDNELCELYLENITGIVIAKPNVVLQ